MADRPDSDIELHRLQLRFAGVRMNDDCAVRRLMQSIDACGQLVAGLAVRDDSDEAAPLVLIDGYRRVAALRGSDATPPGCAAGATRWLRRWRSYWHARSRPTLHFRSIAGLLACLQNDVSLPRRP